MITRRTLSVPELDLDIPYFEIQGRGDGPRPWRSPLAILAPSISRSSTT
jgi:hypothetical protein